MIIAEKMKAIVEPFVYMVPNILKQSGIFNLLLKVREEESLSYSRTTDGVPKQETL